MSGVNRAILVGRLGKDPETKFLDDGKTVTNFSVATDEQWTDKQGQKQKRVEWHRIVCWEKLAEICGKYLAKGRQVYVEGKIQTRKWTDKDGAEKYSTEIVAQQVVFLGDKPAADGPPTEQPGPANPQPGPANPPASDDDVSF